MQCGECSKVIAHICSCCILSPVGGIFGITQRILPVRFELAYYVKNLIVWVASNFQLLSYRKRFIKLNPNRIRTREARPTVVHKRSHFLH